MWQGGLEQETFSPLVNGSPLGLQTFGACLTLTLSSLGVLGSPILPPALGAHHRDLERSFFLWPSVSSIVVGVGRVHQKWQTEVLGPNQDTLCLAHVVVFCFAFFSLFFLSLALSLTLFFPPLKPVLKRGSFP